MGCFKCGKKKSKGAVIQPLSVSVMVEPEGDMVTVGVRSAVSLSTTRMNKELRAGQIVKLTTAEYDEMKRQGAPVWIARNGSVNV